MSGQIYTVATSCSFKVCFNNGTVESTDMTSESISNAAEGELSLAPFPLYDCVCSSQLCIQQYSNLSYPSGDNIVYALRSGLSKCIVVLESDAANDYHVCTRQGRPIGEDAVLLVSAQNMSVSTNSCM